MANDSSVTRNRRTHVRFGLAETTSSEPPQAHSRAGTEMGRGGLGDANSSNVVRTAIGSICLKAYQQTLTVQTEQTDPTGSTIVPLSDFQTIPGYVERNHYTPPTFGGLTPLPATAAGLPMAEKTVPASQSGGFVQTLSSDVSAREQPNYPSVIVKMDRHAVSNVVFDENQAFTFRFKTPPGHGYTASQICFHFGGPVNSYGNGQYSLVAMGRTLFLAEYNESFASGSKWVKVDEWMYITANNPGEIVTLHVRPYRGARGNLFIEFTGDTQADVGNSGNTGGGLTLQIQSAAQSITTHIFKVNTSQFGPSTPPVGTVPTRTKVTGQGVVRIEMAQELRTPWQVSVWRFLPSGYFEDFPLSLPWNISVRSLLTLYYTADVPDGTTLIARLIDATTGVELTSAGSSGDTYKQYTSNPQQPNYYVRFEFTSDSAQKLTPVVYGYSVQRDAWLGTNAPGETDFDGATQDTGVLDVNISGPEADPTHETASLIVPDKTNALAILGVRSSIRTRIETEYDPAHTNLRSVLFDGYLQKAVGNRKGVHGSVYPSPFWRDWECSFVGMWMRLQRSLTMFRLDLQQQDPNVGPDADGLPQPLKVTDICRALLGYAGFSAAQIDVPDSPIRFYPGGTENGNSLMIDPLSNVAEAVVKFLKEYLGWYLIWDGNAGTSGGMWRARPPVPVQGPYVNLANFTLDRQGAGKLATASESYNGNTAGLDWVGSMSSIPTVPIMKGTFHPYVLPPEGNAVCVTATGQYLPNGDGQFQVTNWVCNPKSYDFFTQNDGTPIITSDPNHPDYLGYFAPIVVVNLGLGVGTEGQHNVDVFARRIYDESCHAIKMAPFVGPLCLVVDPNDAHQVNPRPLRYYDPVTITEGGVASQFLVRNCNPAYKKDGKQMAYYELEAPRTD